MNPLTLSMIVLFLFLNLQASWGRWGRLSSSDDHFAKVECWYTKRLQTRYYPRFDCNGDFAEDRQRGVFYVCQGSIQCKNHKDIVINFPRAICKSSHHQGCEMHSAKKCIFGDVGVYFNEDLRQMLPDEIRSTLPGESLLPVITE